VRLPIEVLAAAPWRPRVDSARTDPQAEAHSKGNIVELPKRLEPERPVTNLTRLPCQQHDAALWFSSLPAELNQAKAYCSGCHNREPCLAGALERAEPAGVWGGQIFEQGRIIETKRPRGRPRKATLAPG
jgi:WhiB family redox-sensing transcriptional regulator